MSKISSVLVCSVVILSIYSPIVQNIGHMNSGGIIYVDDDNTSGVEDGSLQHPYNTIQEGVDAAVNGDTVFVFSGTYYENVVIGKTMNLEGENNDVTVIDGGGGIGDILCIMADFVNVTGFTIRKTSKGDGIDILGDYCKISNNILSDNEVGIDPMNNAYIIIDGNTMHNGNIGIYMPTANHGENNTMIITNNTVYNMSGHGFKLMSANQGRNNMMIVNYNKIYNNGGDGIHMPSANSGEEGVIQLNGNKIYNNSGHGMYLISANQNNNNTMTILGNEIHDNNDDGLFLVSANQGENNLMTISDNRIDDNNGRAFDLQSTNQGTTNTMFIQNNEISNHSMDGFYLLSANQGTDNVMEISGNNIYNNGIGFTLDAARQIMIYHNNIINNIVQAQDSHPGKNDWHHPTHLEGNYWSDYTGIDDGSGIGKHANAGDGIGDTMIPHPTSDYDYYPFTDQEGWMETTNQTPVAHAGPDQTVNEGDVVHFDGSGSVGSSTPGGSQPIDLKVAALYHMNEGSGISINDETNNQNDGTIHGATWTSGGKYGNTLSFDGVDDYVEVSDDPSLDIIDKITIEAWVYPRSIGDGNYHRVVDKYYWGTGYALRIEPDGKFSLNVNGWLGSDIALPGNSWSYIAGVSDGTYSTLYLNGQVVKTGQIAFPSGSMKANDLPVRIGCWAGGQQSHFDGVIDEVVIWNKKLSSQEILDYYNSDKEHFMGSEGSPGDIDSYEWDFNADVDSDGDGDPTNDVDATGPTPTHIYGDDGVYNVTLTVKTRVEGGDVVKVDQDCVFCMDSSGSMMWNDPSDLRIAAAQYYVDKMSPDDRAAVVDFDTSAQLMPPGNPFGDHLSMNYATIKSNLDQIDSIGGTGISTGMNLSNVELRDNGDPAHIPIIILLTDAQNNDPIDNSFCLNEANISASMGIKIFTIGLTINGSIEEQLLRDVASITGGKYFPAPDPSYLEAIYEEISIIVENQSTEWLFDTDTMQVTVNNVAPVGGLSGIYFGNEGLDFIITADASDPGSDDLTFIWLFEYGPTITDMLYNDGIGPDPYPSPSGTYPFDASDTVTHIYGDDYDYSLTLTVMDDDGGTVVYTTTINVNNTAPIVTEVIIPYPAEEGGDYIFRTTAKDFGSDDLTFEWDFGDSSPLVTNTYYNDASSPDPFPSPDGIYPFIAQDTVSHTYGDDYDYPITLTITDDDGGVTTFTTTVIVENVDPVIEPFGPFVIDEGSTIDITGIGTDSGSDDLTFTWEFEGGSTITTTHYNDGLGADPFPSPEGLFPFSVTEMVSQTYGDDGNYSIILTVIDDDGGTATYETYVLIYNVPPSLASLDYEIIMINEPRTVGYWGHQCKVEEPYGDHTGILQEWVDNISYQSQVFSWITTEEDVEGVVQEGDASDMIVMAERQLMGVWLNIVSGKLHPATELYMPNLTTSNTVWEAILEIEDVILNSENRTEMERVKNIADNINNGIGIAWGIVEFTASATDPGADDLTFHWDFGDGKSQDNFYPNPGGVFPIIVTDHVEHSYFSQGTFTVTLTVSDDDGGTSVITQLITF